MIPTKLKFWFNDNLVKNVSQNVIAREPRTFTVRDRFRDRGNLTRSVILKTEPKGSPKQNYRTRFFPLWGALKVTLWVALKDALWG